MKTEEARGWGLRVGGPRPYLAWHFSQTKSDAQSAITESYHRAMECVLIPLREYRAIKRKITKLSTVERRARK